VFAAHPPVPFPTLADRGRKRQTWSRCRPQSVGSVISTCTGEGSGHGPAFLAKSFSLMFSLSLLPSLFVFLCSKAHDEGKDGEAKETRPVSLSHKLKKNDLGLAVTIFLSSLHVSMQTTHNEPIKSIKQHQFFLSFSPLSSSLPLYQPCTEDTLLSLPTHTLSARLVEGPVG